MIIIINKEARLIHPQRNTIQRQIILDALKSTDAHPSVDMLYAEIQKNHPSISKATVYRNLRLLAEKGDVLQIAVANDVARYDGCTDFHHHFLCDACGRILDIYINSDADFESIAAKTQVKYGHVVDKSMTTFFGVCADCDDEQQPLQP